MTEQSLATTVVTTTEEFGELTDAWDRLAAGCRSATAFQSHAWLESWALAYCAPGSLRVLVVHAGDDLIAAAPFYVSRRLAVRSLEPLGAGLSDFGDILVADAVDERRADVLAKLVTALLQVSGWDVIDLPEVRPGAAAHELRALWPGPSGSIVASTCLELPVQEMPDLLARLPRSTAKHVRTKLRKIDQAGVAAECVVASEVPGALEEFQRLHAEHWRHRGVTAEHLRHRFATFLGRAIPLMVERRQAVVVQYRLSGAVVGVRINVIGGAMMGAYLSGISPAMRQQVDVATVMLRHNLALARERELQILSLLRGQEDYKLRWRPVSVTNSRIVLGRPGNVLAAASVALARGWAHALPYLREHAPWLRSVRTALRRLVQTLR
jgi:CelD/BcsL family acetyltransferase involved in cellulose biosynthesis